MDIQAATPGNTKQKRHSRSGITSFVLAVFALLLLVGSDLYWRYCASLYGYVDSFGDPILATSDENLIVIGYALSELLFLVSTGFGIYGLRQRDAHKVFPIFGTLLSASVLLMLIARIVWLLIHHG